MSIKYKVKKNGFLVFADAGREISATDIIKMENSIIADERVKPGFNSLFDWTRVSKLENIENDIGEIIKILASDRKNIHGKKIAIVARPGIASELSRIADSVSEYNENVNLIFFNDLNTAEIWLGVQ